MGFDVMQYNLHKTFATPHGGGGPGSGPVAVKAALAPFLPLPVVVEGGRDLPAGHRCRRSGPRPSASCASSAATSACSCAPGPTSASWGPEGLKATAELAVLNANYVRARARGTTTTSPTQTDSLHEVVFDDKAQKDTGVTTMDIAKRLIDHGFHPPTIYFPLVVHGALMIEPTETESKETHRRLRRPPCRPSPRRRGATRRRSRPRPQKPVRARLDETRAARKPVLRWTPGMKVE